MSSRGSRVGWLIVIPGLMLAIWLTGASTIFWEGLGPRKRRIGDRLVRMVTGRGQEAHDSAPAPTGPVEMSDPRLSSLLRAAETWKRSTGPRRLVVDQVCLVPDVAAFFEAIAAWDEQYFFPILIDEPVWTLPFLRAFRPARVVRYVRRARPIESRPGPASSNRQDGRDAVWSQARRAVSRAWSRPSESDGVLPDAGLPPRELGATPPAIVLTAPRAPMLAGAVALAAGRFQPLVRLPASAEETIIRGGSVQPSRFGDVLSMPQAWNFARKIEERVASVIPAYAQLGDDCDFLTLAADWPYRYSCEEGDESIRGLYALDDLIGRRFEFAAGASWLNQTRRRWAYTGRLLGDPAASVARAMGSLFLQPSSTLLWNTYRGGKPWSDYTMRPAAYELSPAIAGAVVERSDGNAGLASWHRVVDPVNRFGMILFNSSGGPDWFNINGGVGRPSDVPRGVPAIVAMIHSFSAADPTDPQTIAGRWLAQGAFNYFGAVHEPFLLAFRPPGLVAELMAAQMPLVAALRQGESEIFGFPWRLCYLGDPLYRLQNAAITASERPAVKENAQAWKSSRVDPSEWRKTEASYADWPVTELSSLPSRSGQPSQGGVADSDEERLRWCLDAATKEAAGQRAPAASGPAYPMAGWRRTLSEIRRDRLPQRLRPLLDDLLIDDLAEIGACEQLMTRFAQVPPAERGPRLWQALETCAMIRLARLTQEGDTTANFVRVLDLWDEVIRLNWPKSSHFPAQYTERVAAVASSDRHRRRLWLDRVERAGLASTIQAGLH